MNSRHRTGNVLGAKDVPFIAYYLNCGLTFPFPLFFSLLLVCPRVRRAPSCIVMSTVSTELHLKLQFAMN